MLGLLALLQKENNPGISGLREKRIANVIKSLAIKKSKGLLPQDLM